MPMRPHPPWTGEKMWGWSAMKAVCCSRVSLRTPQPLFLGGEGGEDLVVEAEVGVVHVGAFDGSRELEGEAAEEGYARVHVFICLSSSSSLGGPPPGYLAQ